MNTWLILRIILILLILGGIGFGVFLYFMTQHSPSIIGNEYDKKIKKEIENKGSQKKYESQEDRIYLLKALENNQLTITSLSKNIPNTEYKILAKDLNSLMKEGYINPIVNSSENIQTLYELSQKGKDLLLGEKGNMY